MVCVSQVGVGVWADLPSGPDRTMLLIFSARTSVEHFDLPLQEIEPTNVNDISTSARIKMQRSIAGWAVLSVKFADVLIKTSLMRDMLARELQNTFSSESMLERLLAYRTFTSNERSLAPCARTLCGARHDVVVDSTSDATCAGAGAGS